MKTKKIISLIFVISFGLNIYAQGVYNSGASIYVEDGTIVTIAGAGNYTNQSSGHLILKGDGAGQEGELIIPGNFVNTSGDVTLSQGKITLSGDFTNNDATNNVFLSANDDGEIVFAGSGTQTITSSEADMSNFIDFEKVTVNSGSTTLLAAGSAATTNGDLVVDGTFRLSSPSDGEDPSGSLITEANVSGTGNLYVDRHFETGDRWQYISVPVNNATDDLFDNTLNSHNFNANIYTYNEAYDAVDPSNTDYSNWTDPAYGLYNAWESIAVDGSSVALTPGTGYITYNETELDISFGGSPSNLNNDASYSPAISYNNNDGGSGAGDYFDGWNIIGNPYPCAVDFTALNTANVNTTVYFWDGDAKNYKYYTSGGTTYADGTNSLSGATQFIPAMQSFAIKTNDGGTPTISFEKVARVHNNQTMWKSNKDEIITQYLRLKIDGDYSDETIVRFFDEATSDFDNNHDAFKMFPNNDEVPMIYSLVTESVEYPLAINSLPISSLGTTIPLGVKTGTAGTYTIQISDFNFDAGTEVKLIDTKENTEVELYEGIEYTFDFSGDENRTRFYLFKGASSIDEEPITDDIETNTNIWSNENKVYVTVSSYKLVDADVQIFDMLGRQVIDRKLSGAYNIIDMNGASGTYFVKLRTKDGQVRTEKVFIKK